MSQICVVRPANDSAAKTLAGMAAPLNSIIPGSGHTVRDLFHSAADRPTVEKALASCRAILFLGHGRKSRLQGATTDLIDTANVVKAKGRIIVAIACWSAHTLGPYAIANGIEAYLGFDDMLGCLKGDPDNQFGPACISGIELMLNGKDIGDALATMLKKFDDVFDYYRNGAGKASSDAVLGWLLADWNKKHCKLLGLNGARL